MLTVSLRVTPVTGYCFFTVVNVICLNCILEEYFRISYMTAYCLYVIIIHKQESHALAKITARCAQCMGDLNKKLSYRRETARQLHTTTWAGQLTF